MLYLIQYHLPFYLGLTLVVCHPVMTLMPFASFCERIVSLRKTACTIRANWCKCYKL